MKADLLMFVYMQAIEVKTMIACVELLLDVLPSLCFATGSCPFADILHLQPRQYLNIFLILGGLWPRPRLTAANIDNGILVVQK